MIHFLSNVFSKSSGQARTMPENTAESHPPTAGSNILFIVDLTLF